MHSTPYDSKYLSTNTSINKFIRETISKPFGFVARRYLFLTYEVKRLNFSDVKQSPELSRECFASKIYNSSFSVILCILRFLLPGCECFAFAL